MHSKRNKSWFVKLTLLSILLLASALVSVFVGEIDFSLAEMVQGLHTQEGMVYTVLVNLRLPRLLLAIAVGGGLSIAGVLLQSIYRNPLVEPYTLGVSGGAALGVAVCIVGGLHHIFGSYSITLFSAMGAYATIALVYVMSSQRGKNLQINRMLLIGVMVSFVASSAMMLLMSLSTAEELHSIVFWIMGSLNEPNLGLILLCLSVSVLTLIISYIYVHPLNAMRLGQVEAKQVGVNTRRLVRVLFLLSSVVTGVCVSVSGIIGFVGLVIPHLVRHFVGSDYRILLVSSFLSGGILLIFSDLLARTVIAPNELPIGVITGILGGVFFIVALTQKKS